MFHIGAYQILWLYSLEIILEILCTCLTHHDFFWHAVLFKGSIIKAPNGFAAYSLLMVIKTQGLGTPRPNSAWSLKFSSTNTLLLTTLFRSSWSSSFSVVGLPVCRQCKAVPPKQHPSGNIPFHHLDTISFNTYNLLN